MAKLSKAYDVLVIGGGPAGLSAALALGRMKRTALVCDDGRPRNAPSSHANNLPSQDGIHPGLWREKARADLRKYKTIEFHDGAVHSVVSRDKHFLVELGSGESLVVRKVILAHGIRDRLPAIEGLEALWGKAAFHCPYCHGFEIQGKKLGLIGNGKMAEHLIPMLATLSDDLMLLTQGPSELDPEFRSRLDQHGIKVVEKTIATLDFTGEELKAVRFEDGQRLEREALFIAPTFPIAMKADFGEKLGCEKTEMGHFKTVETGKTTVAGVFAAGDIAVGPQSVLGAASLGQLAGAGAVHELVHEDFKLGRTSKS